MLLGILISESKPAAGQSHDYEYSSALEWNQSFYSIKEPTIQEKFDLLFSTQGKESSIRKSAIEKMRPLVREVDHNIKLMESLRASLSAHDVAYLKTSVDDFNALVVRIDQLVKEAEDAKKSFLASVRQKQKITSAVKAVDDAIINLAEYRGKIELAVTILVAHHEELVKKQERDAREAQQKRLNDAERKRIKKLEEQFKEFLLETHKARQNDDYSKLSDHEKEAHLLLENAGPETKRIIDERINELQQKANKLTQGKLIATQKGLGREEEIYGYNNHLLRNEAIYVNAPHVVAAEPIHASIRIHKYALEK